MRLKAVLFWEDYWKPAPWPLHLSEGDTVKIGKREYIATKPGTYLNPHSVEKAAERNEI